MGKMNLLFLCCVFATLIETRHGYTILGLFPLPAKSHMIFFEKLMSRLAEKGHNVDVLSHFPLKTPIARYNDISVYGSIPIFQNNMNISYAQKVVSDGVNLFMTQFAYKLCETIFNTSAAHKLKNSKQKYDLIIIEGFGSDCFVPFGYHFKAPVIIIDSSTGLPWNADRVGNPDNPSYIPQIFSTYTSKMSFVEIAYNAIMLSIVKLSHRFISNRRSAESVKAFFGPNLPNIEDLAANISLVMTNSHFSFSTVRPTVPNFIEVGGLHIDHPKPLSKHFEKVLNINNNYHGVIYFSTGSLITSETFSPVILKAFFETFKTLPYKVLWKAAAEQMPKDLDVPPNVHFESWVPQLDVLCHPNVKLFITHGGLLGTQEAVYCGVPRLGIPLFFDQTSNIKTSERLGVAISMDYNEITKDKLSNAVRALLEDPKYRINAKKASEIFKDRPLSGMDTAIYWIEYVIRHRGAAHLRTVGADLPWHQYFLLDVIVALLLTIMLIVIITYYLCKISLSLVRGNVLTKSKYQ